MIVARPTLPIFITTVQQITFHGSLQGSGWFINIDIVTLPTYSLANDSSTELDGIKVLSVFVVL